ncbi:acetylornithine deacetylase [Pseudomaricurvus alkylphenolicus]|jgi:acetylornithine deacetylase|uniref:acetylornithine deacetylase n=1 Tax=Pseudomaricurvus alkylphenolicus TaxID=1306991 RepID=UPI0014228BA4|nr:acetylornithine deacetylase [Pseudomaricurvus alkylphenolicus]NIB42819.1 acetylornithine deacetylase [Pseudomaricurvus alkylphenolicus]
MPLPNLFDQLQELVATPSVSSYTPSWDMGNRAVVELLATWLRDLGFNCEILDVPGGNGKKCNLIATLGSGPGGLVLSGHTDTVPYDDGKWQSDPFKLQERDNRWYGLGSTDMKGFFPVAIEAARAFSETPLQQPLIILATADEESSMSGARALAQMGRPKARYAVIGEPTGLQPIRMHKGIMMESVQIEGLSGHSSDPSLGNNALESMHQVISELITYRQQLQQRYQHPGFAIPVPTLNLGCIHGGDNPNRICGHCELQFDLRAVPGMDNDALRGEIDLRLSEIAERSGSRIQRQTLFGGVPAYEEPANSELVKAVESHTGHHAASVAFATEAPYLQQLGMETIVMGPGSIDQAHQPNEFIPTEQIKPAVETLKALIRQFCL